MRVLLRELVGLNDEKRMLVYRVGDGSIIKLFDKTPSPRELSDVVCPHFLELKWANGCYFDCAWCYLNGTYRFYPDWKNGNPHVKSFCEIERHLKALLSSDGAEPLILNAGELSDSLLAERGTMERLPFSQFIIGLLKKYDPEDKHRVLFLTKSTDIGKLLELREDGRKKIIMGFTLNADAVSKTWEKRAPPVNERIEAARRIFEAGYTTRVRIDPIVPIDNWGKHYTQLLDKIFSSFKPERVTLGSLRGLPSTIAKAKDKSWIGYLSEKSNWGRKVQFKIRYEIYASIIRHLRTQYEYQDIALCKETVAVWEKLGLDYRQIKCNCVE